MRREIRTELGKLFGVFDEMTNVLEIKDGKNTRQIQIPTDGLTLIYKSGNGIPETIYLAAKPM